MAAMHIANIALSKTHVASGLLRHINMQQVVIEIGEYYGTMEVNGGDFSNYIARIYRNEGIGKMSRLPLVPTLLVYKSFGNGVDAENWLLDCLEYPSFVHLLRK
jgi:hypothetical protein